jgi:hypothetical protein
MTERSRDGADSPPEPRPSTGELRRDVDQPPTLAGVPRADATVIEGAARPQPRRIAGYELVEPLGRGGMGEVWKARDRELDRFVALKLMDTGGRFRDAEARFRREARAAASISHPNVAQVYAAGLDGGQLYFVMELVAGESLQQRLAGRGLLPVGEAVALLRQAAEGLRAAHEAGVIHRDIKPSNLMVGLGGRLKVVDFGLARRSLDATLTRPRVALGTPSYMAPEQARGDQVDHRADLYALGATFYHLLAGQPPFRADSPVELLDKIVREAAVPLHERNPAVPRWLSALVARLLAKQPETRPQSYDELLAALVVVETRGALPAGAGTGAKSAPAQREVIAPGPVVESFGSSAVAAPGVWRSEDLLSRVAPPSRWRGLGVGLAVAALLAASVAAGTWWWLERRGGGAPARRGAVAADATGLGAVGGDGAAARAGFTLRSRDGSAGGAPPREAAVGPGVDAVVPLPARDAVQAPPSPRPPWPRDSAAAPGEGPTRHGGGPPASRDGAERDGLAVTDAHLRTLAPYLHQHLAATGAAPASVAELVAAHALDPDLAYDGWGSPLRLEQPPIGPPLLVSRGPDRIERSADDLVFLAGLTRPIPPRLRGLSGGS